MQAAMRTPLRFAGDLEEGTTLVDNEGNELHLLIKRWEQLQSAIPVYNFAVEDYHTYFVGSKNVLVHNACGEQVLESQTSHDNARKVLIDELDKMGAFKNGSKPNIGSLESSYGYGKVIGRKSLDGKVCWRLDYDPVKGVHYNIDSWLNGKRALRIKKAIPIDIPYEEYVKIIDLWN
ncbi:polymorphic toxin-type HINT domain-containing protein [Butyrivibrio sp. MC2021]|uniref:polymorphic toxin-type HINT domain-containing protein n=1 Tax=Butyrivibrio sp. MC2021 TaxID=1408306 RepID=UPI0012DD15DF|nr:polymorphic toxin-type HINT domain-containing protein [Butyrivibrio sp. MC2021]